MALATISAISTPSPAAEVVSANNLAFTLVTTTLGKLVVVFAVSRDATINYTALSSSNVGEWNSVGTFSFATNGGVAAQVITVFIGQVTAVSSATVTATPSASMAAVSGGFSWREVTTSAVTAGTWWVAEAVGSLRNTGSSTDLQLPTLVPLGANRAYIGYCDPNGTATPTGVTAGYTATAGTGDLMGNQWVTNLAVTGSQSPVGKQTVAGVSDTVGILLRAHEADTAVATNLNIGAAGGKNHFKLQTSFLGYNDDTEKSQAQIIAGMNTDPQFRANADGSVTFAVQAGAPGTSPSTTYPRCELAELAPDGVTDLAWNAMSGIHWIRGRTRIGTLGPNRPHATLFQLHDGRGGFTSLVGEVIQISAQINGGTGVHELRLRLWDTTVNIPPLAYSADYGDVIDWMCYINAGYWAFYYQDLGTPFYDSNNFVADGYTDVFTGNAEYYFKCGMYPQTNEAPPANEDPAAIQSADLMFVRHWHTGWTVADAVTLPKTAQFSPFFG